MLSVPFAEITESGLTGDHARPGKRAVTLFQAEHIDVIGQFLKQSLTAPEAFRRNLHVAGFNLSSTRGAWIACGSAVLEITGPCAPCSRMSEVFGPGGYNAMRGHGGWCAKVVRPGRITLGDSLTRL